MLTIFQGRVQAEREQFNVLRFLRKKYQLVDIKSDKYLGRAYAQSGKARQLQTAPFLIKLNHKSAIKPKTSEVKALKGHKLSHEFELMRRVIVEQKKGATTDGNQGISLIFHPKLRKGPLQYLVMQIEFTALNPDNQSKFDAVLKMRRMSYTFDLYQDVPIKSENELDAEIREKLRSLLLYDLLFKMQQESELNKKTDIIIDSPTSNTVHATFQLQNVLSLKVTFEFKDILEIIEAPQQNQLIPRRTMLRLLINLAETTFSANILKNLFFMLTKHYLSKLLTAIFLPQPHDLVNYRVNQTFAPYESIGWELSKRKLIVANCRRAEQGSISGYETIGVYIPRLRIDVQFNFSTNPNISVYSPIPSNTFAQIILKEDVLDGLVQNESNPHRYQVLNNNQAQRKVTHFEQLSRVADDMQKLLGFDQMQWDQ